MNIMANKTDEASFLGKLTFGSVTILIIAGIALLNIVHWLIKPHSTSGAAEPSLIVLLIYNPLMLLGFWLIYSTRRKTEYYQLRLLFYAMLLTGVTVELAHYALRVLSNGH